ncbi:hypothetical protein RFI_04723 [Reticulomyxa filosa]|uniref:Flavoprotein domain-containing protein n=1 Tax=Reticulomyxa filosa TaxID=46433 RepID=X6P2U9_RETFI|nr:hypothetical protein RFI_04723 [Reticulomyxa filosa]|eukprot:ETO32394.1 hypothetical protein RFI_04723 [Reticulomyxa filosa]
MTDNQLTLRKPRILVGATGSVATIKLDLLCQQLSVFAEVIEYLCDNDEWQSWQKRGDPVLHIELRKWADIFLIAPLDANTLSKFAHGLCDNLLTSVFRAWDFSNSHKIVILAPAMNTYMWDNPLTSKCLEKLQKQFKYSKIHIIWPISKQLMCKDVGVGAMEEVPKIVQAVHSQWQKCLKDNDNNNDIDTKTTAMRASQIRILVASLVLFSFCCISLRNKR